MRNQQIQNQQLADVTIPKSFNEKEVLVEKPIEEKNPDEKLGTALNKVKVELINNKKNILVEKIKKIVIEMIYYSEEQIKTNFSDHLSQKMGYHYTYLANLFGKVHGSSIRHFIITTRIERVKELLVYEDMLLTEIAFKLHYSSVAHLSNQFKKVTGTSPSRYLASKEHLSRLLPRKSAEITDINANRSPVNSELLPVITPQPVINLEGVAQ
jgi:AraC-like DNA-binding protein